MADGLASHEGAFRLGVFLAVLAVMAAWELAAPLRRAEVPRVIRWSNNLALVAVDTAIVRLLFPLAAVGVAAWAQGAGFGLLHALALPGWAAVVVAMVALDLGIWAQHVLFHKVPWLWRLHRVHHADTHFDVTTGVRFHPLEIVVSMAIKMALVAALGAPVLAVLLFEVALSAGALITHANLSLPARLDRALRRVVVTPDMHRIHHSVRQAETDSNYGFNLAVWDRLFGTYRAQPQDGQKGMTIGIGQFRDSREAWIDRLLTQPFRGSASDPGIAGQDRRGGGRAGPEPGAAPVDPGRRD
jgi:sterol desaturase/sphingolipid hydroxylase (fatty acid hydroxylase superfamily)